MAAAEPHAAVGPHCFCSKVSSGTLWEANPFLGVSELEGGGVRPEGAGPGHRGLIRALQPAGKAVGGPGGSIFNRELEIPKAVSHPLPFPPQCSPPGALWPLPCRSWGGSPQGTGVKKGELALPPPHPLSAQPGWVRCSGFRLSGVGEAGTFLAWWDCPPIELCEELQASKVSLQPRGNWGQKKGRTH